MLSMTEYDRKSLNAFLKLDAQRKERVISMIWRQSIEQEDEENDAQIKAHPEQYHSWWFCDHFDVSNFDAYCAIPILPIYRVDMRKDMTWARFIGYRDRACTEIVHLFEATDPEHVEPLYQQCLASIARLVHEHRQGQKSNHRRRRRRKKKQTKATEGVVA